MSLFRAALAGQSKRDGRRSADALIGSANSFPKARITSNELLPTPINDLGYVVQLEHIRFVKPGQAKESTLDYRVTMLFRLEPDGWRIIHRQADSQMLKQAPK